MKNSQYTVALHTLALLAMMKNMTITSIDIAQSVNTNPVVIRRIIASLRNAGLVTSRLGVGGGIELNQNPESITLCDVYRLFKSEDVFPMHTNTPNANCPCGNNIQPVLRGIYNDVDMAIETTLAQKTIADLAQEIWQTHNPQTRDE